MANLRNKKVLITSGPTWVPIDSVRVISNTSTGRMGHLLVEAFCKVGAKVTLLEGPVTDFLKNTKVTVRRFCFFDELDRILQSELKRNFDIVVHAAAISDYRLKKVYRNKLRSGLSALRLELVPTPKLINKIRHLAPATTLVGFKLEPSGGRAQLRKQGMVLATKAGCALVVINSLKNGKYRGHLIDPQGRILASASSREELARELINTLKDLK